MRTTPMLTESDVPLLIVSGTVGVGKSAVLDEIHHVLRTAHLPHACIDLDAIGLSWPIRGVFNQTSILENLGALWGNFRAAGARRLAIAGVVERPDDLAALRLAVPGARVVLCQLLASDATRLQRLRQREVGAGFEWHVQRTSELQAILERAALHDFTVVNDARAVRDVAHEVLIRAGWFPGSAAHTSGSPDADAQDLDPTDR